MKLEKGTTMAVHGAAAARFIEARQSDDVADDREGPLVADLRWKP